MEERYERLPTDESILVELPKIEDPSTAPDTQVVAGNNTGDNEDTNTAGEEVNDTEETGVETTNETAEDTGAITGNVVASDSDSSDKEYLSYLLYIIGAIVVIGIVLFAGVAIVKSKKEKRYIPPAMRPLKLAHPGNTSNSFGDSEVERIERKIQEIDKRIDEIKNGDKLKDVEKKLEERMNILENLKKRKEEQRHDENKKYY